MGNCFGKESTPSSSTLPARRNNFSTPGRTLGGSSNSTHTTTATAPGATTANAPPAQVVGYENGPVATLAGGFGAPTSKTPLLHHHQQQNGAGGVATVGDAKSAAARAAEERAAKAAQSGPGALEQKLAQQRKQNALKEAAAENLRNREIDQVAEARNYN